MQEQTLPEIDVIEENELELNDIKLYSLLVYNDEVNTFEYVIQTLVEVCEHSPDQAEQCTMIIHFKGKCQVKNGDFKQLASMRNEICRRGISAEVILR